MGQPQQGLLDEDQGDYYMEHMEHLEDAVRNWVFMTSEFEKKPQEIVDMNVGGIFMGRYMLQVSSEPQSVCFSFLGGTSFLSLTTFGRLEDL